MRKWNPRMSDQVQIHPVLPDGNGGFTACPELLTGAEAIRYVRLEGDRNPVRTLRYYRERGLLKATTVGRHLCYRRVELDAFLARLTASRSKSR